MFGSRIGMNRLGLEESRQFLRDFEQCSTYAWGPAVLAYLYREMCSATDYKVKSIRGMCILIQMWAWERCTTLAPKRTPPVIENKPLGHRFVVKKITFELKIFNDGTC